ncbi:MAG TPA: DUF4097 family beta strand repeat-containing protein [Micromonosporaceae bacterium]|nr:DUF4097 family beta strand repeat-containing protein [Micromonosporaceae bacterium]
MPEFTCPGPITLTARLGGGSIEVVAEDRPNATVEVLPYDTSDSSREAAANTRVEMHDARLHIEAPETGGFVFRRSPRVRVEARVPTDSALEAKVASADLTAHGRFTSAAVKSASGEVHLDHVTGDATIGTASGDVRVVRVDGALRVNAASGDVSAHAVTGPVTAHAASGGVEIDLAGGSVQAQTASGDVRVGSARRGAVNVTSASGDVEVGVEPGTGVWLDLTTLSGSTRSDLSTSDAPASGEPALTIQVRTMSGDIDVHRVKAAA